MPSYTPLTEKALLNSMDKEDEIVVIRDNVVAKVKADSIISRLEKLESNVDVIDGCEFEPTSIVDIDGIIDGSYVEPEQEQEHGPEHEPATADDIDKIIDGGYVDTDTEPDACKGHNEADAIDIDDIIDGSYVEVPDPSPEDDLATEADIDNIIDGLF